MNQDPDTARGIARRFLAPILGMAHYAHSMLRQGFTESDLADGGSDRLVDRLIAWGSPDAIATHMRAQHDAGANHVALHVVTAARESPLQTWRELSFLTR